LLTDSLLEGKKMPLAANCQKLKKGKTRGNPSPPTHSIIYPPFLHKHADGSSDGLGWGYPSQATL